MANRPGRPSKYSEELADKICSLMAAGNSLHKICKADDMPNKETVFNWLQTNDAFLCKYTQARTDQMETMSYEIQEICDDESGDMYQGEKGLQPNHAKIQRDKLRVDTRKWLMSKIMPQKYGDSIKIGGDKANPVRVIMGKDEQDL